MWQEEDGSEDVQYNAADILDLNITPEYRDYLYTVCMSCVTYINLTAGHYGTKVAAECARGLLPLDTATYFLQCGFTRDWKDFFRQRLDAGAHPDARHITQELVKEFTQNNITDLAN
jgi:thymidylate synthase ThyX